MRPSMVLTILRKELLDTRRDRRTLFMMVVLPVMLYPAMLLVGVQLLMVHQERVERTLSKVHVAALNDVDREIAKGWFVDAVDIELTDSPDPWADLAARNIQAVVVLRAPLLDTLDAWGTLPVDVLYDATEHESRLALNRVEDVLDDVFLKTQRERLEREGVNPEYINPVEWKAVDTAPDEKTTGTILGTMLPGLLVMVIALGAFYPAVDLTAGEKERGTFETLLSTPASKLEIVTGKFLTVFLLALLTALLNLASMGGTVWVLLAQVQGSLGGDAGISLTIQNPLWVIGIVILNLVPLALLLSAVMMSVAVFAGSFKEAQNYLTPVLLLMIMPVMLAVTPGAELSAALRFVPVVNAVLLFKDGMVGRAGWEDVFAVFISTAAYALLALNVAAWLFQREEVVLSEEPAIPLSWRRSDYEPRETPSPALAMSLFGLVMLLLFYVATYAQMRAPLPGLILTEWGLILAPVVGVLWFVRADLRKSLQLRGFRPAQGLGALVLAVSTLALVMGFSILLDQFLPVPESMKEGLKDFLGDTGSPGGKLLLFFAMAVSPAVCEEVLFRGAILTGLSRKLRPLAAVTLTAVLFGVFHLSIYRFAPTALIGMSITYAVFRTRSLWIGMLMHFLNNGLAIALGLGMLPEMLRGWLPDLDAAEAAPSPALLAAAAFGVLLGALLIEWSTRRKNRSNAA